MSASVLDDAAQGRVIAAIATPAGEGALGIVRLSGPRARAVAGAFVRPIGKPRVATMALVHDGKRALDQVLATFFPAPRSYTGEDVLELSGHGSPYLLSRILELALRSGARLAEPGEFTRRAFLNGRLDLAQAEAVGLLIRSRSEAAARAAFAQLEGRLSGRVLALRRSIVSVLATVEASLDHPDEDLPAFDPARAASRIGLLSARVGRLLDTHRLGRLASEGARVSIVGRPNAGKSSLLNALLGRERAIVAAEPGTTRDTLEEPADLGGTRALLVDTAGLRGEAAAGPIEREGMRRARLSLSASDLAVVVLDRSVPFEEEDRGVLAEAAAGGRAVVVALNKIDLPPCDASPRSRALDPFAVVPVSALRGEGVDRLADALRAAVARMAAAPEGEAIVVSVRHRLALEEARNALDGAAARAAEGELAAVHLREALGALGAIVGDTAPEEVLRDIFSRFCVGK